MKYIILLLFLIAFNGCVKDEQDFQYASEAPKFLVQSPTDKNKTTMPDKMEIKKFDPVARKHVIYKEEKIK